MSADQKGFEAWAFSHGGMSLKLAPKMETIIGRFPATYYVDETEIAWRAWANKPAAIAPPVAAGSVDTEEFRRLCRAYYQEQPSLREGDRLRLVAHTDAWGAQQREAGLAEAEDAGIKIMRQHREYNAKIKAGLTERAEKAEARAAQLSSDLLAAHGDRDAYLSRALEAEARVKDLQADLDIELERAYDRLLAARAAKQARRQALQAEGKHPAPCARHCEANAFQIEVRRLEEESAHKQSIIDRLMLEYCPDEMTPQQVKEWAKHQVRAEVQHHPV